MRTLLALSGQNMKCLLLLFLVALCNLQVWSTNFLSRHLFERKRVQLAVVKILIKSLVVKN